MWYSYRGSFDFREKVKMHINSDMQILKILLIGTNATNWLALQFQIKDGTLK